MQGGTAPELLERRRRGHVNPRWLIKTPLVLIEPFALIPKAAVVFEGVLRPEANVCLMGTPETASLDVVGVLITRIPKAALVFEGILCPETNVYLMGTPETTSLDVVGVLITTHIPKAAALVLEGVLRPEAILDLMGPPETASLDVVSVL